MYNLDQAISHINSIKPDLTEFNEILVKGSQSEVLADIQATSDDCVKALKAELTATYLVTHNQRYPSSDLRNHLEDVLEQTFTFYNPYGHTKNWNILSNYSISDSFDLKTHLLAHLTDVKQYLPKYLWNKVRDRKTATVKEIKPDEFSLAVFKQHLSTLPKGLSSADAHRYIDRVRIFQQPIKDKYVELILDNCPKPSIKLQNDLYYLLPNNSKYVQLNRAHIRNLAYRLELPMPHQIWDERDSDFKPFITNLPRTPTPSKREFLALYFTALLLSHTAIKADKYMSECIMEHLSDPAYTDVMQETKESILQFTDTITNFIKDS